MMYQQVIPVIGSILTNGVVLGECDNDFAEGDAVLSDLRDAAVLDILDGENHHYYDAFGLPDQANPNCYYSVSGGQTNVTLPEMLDRELSYYPVPSNTIWIMDENALYGSAMAVGATSSVLGISQVQEGGPPYIPFIISESAPVNTCYVEFCRVVPSHLFALIGA
jgi:hypothetical protein